MSHDDTKDELAIARARKARRRAASEIEPIALPEGLENMSEEEVEAYIFRTLEKADALAQHADALRSWDNARAGPTKG